MRNVEDKFNRGNYVDFICDLIKNCNDYKRQDGESSYIVAIDSAWGTGKTTLVGFLEKKLAEQKNMKVVVYNAWDNDYFDNAFEPLFYSIIKSDAFNTVKNNENLLSLLNSVENIPGAIVKDVAEVAHAQRTLKAVKGSFKSLIDCFVQNVEASQKFRQRKDAFDKFGSDLKKATQWFEAPNHKLVIIIDELDRCKPPFAIRTLEIAKHFFNIDNVIFVFALDIRQLSSSIKCVYGQNMDTTGYLCRFFDYISKMPTIDVFDYIHNELTCSNILPQIQVEDLKKECGTIGFSVAISRCIKEMATAFNLSVRDIDTILQNYKIMLNTVLFNHGNIGEHYIYVFYLVMKYKRPDLFGYLFLDKHISNNEKITDELDCLSRVNSGNVFIRSAYNSVRESGTLGERKWSLFCDARGKQGYLADKIIDVNEKVILGHGKMDNRGSWRPFDKPDKNTQSCSNILFRTDLEKWDEIKNLTYAEYLHRQLENYNFSVFLDDGI